MDNPNNFKNCSVPMCQNTSTFTPQKIFIPVPLNIKRRNLWLRVAKRNPKELAGNSRIYFCEDHFNLKTDMVNYLQYGLGLSKKVEMVPGCIPTKFECQMSRKMNQTSRTAQVPPPKKILLDLTDDKKKQTELTSSITESSEEFKSKFSNNTKASKPAIDAGLSENAEDLRKVFVSDVTRSEPTKNNCLYDLIKIIPAKPAAVPASEPVSVDFVPNTNKYYIPKKKSTLKVRTVRSVRKEIEQDVYNYLPKALDKQKKYLLKKIMDGSAKNPSTQSMAKNVLGSDHPILKSSWQMLMNINPENHLHSKQYVLYDGKCIQVNGSKGGRNKFIYNYDLGSPRLQHYITAKKKLPIKKKGLLQNSLTVRFKPGPLRRKKYLDDSHQQYHVGSTEVVCLPKLGLDIQPFYGMTLESGIAKFVNSLRNENGIISEKWAEFAVTMLGSDHKSKAIQLNPDEVVNFDLKYRCNQNRILMRRDVEDIKDTHAELDGKSFSPPSISEESMTVTEIKGIMDKILDSVEISLEQENMYSGEDEARDTICDRPINVNNSKDKLKRRYCELGRLDVTVIRLPENPVGDESAICNKSFCELGCICASLECSHNIKTHCGLVGCMFQCTCDFSRYMDVNILKSGCSDFIPGLVSLDTEINLRLAKEEQKFRQTVIVSGENSILLKNRKRNWKASKKYGDFYSNLNLKADKKAEMVLSIVDLNCKNIEPWCMVHNLYKCFCKGRFTETCLYDCNEGTPQTTETVEEETINNKSLEAKEIVDNVPDTKAVDNQANSIDTNNTKECEVPKFFVPDNSYHEERYRCARAVEYKGRKYSNGYYKNTNNKIIEMERNDKKLKKRLMYILQNNENKNETDVMKNTSPEPVVDVGITPLIKSPEPSPPDIPFVGPNQKQLATWLESSYKLCKQRLNQDITKTSLEPPTPGKLTLYTWEFIFQRYKQRKNFFMVSKREPFRLFIGVNGKSRYFSNCIDISQIELADVDKYPSTVKSILCSVTDSQEDFCILCGWPDYWEIVGSVSKLSENCESDTMNDTVLTSKHRLSARSLLKETEFSKHKRDKSPLNAVSLKYPSTSDSSKWFVMKVENDFSEIQFFTRGFFVTYSSIIKAINVARGTGKTVRLSSQKCADKGSGPQFGIYAIPDAKEYCVFVGPYEMDELLGIETIKNMLYARKDRKTRGVWITTDKFENGKVIDNPLSYMPSSYLNKNNMVDLDNDDSLSNTDNSDLSLNQTKSFQIETPHESAKIHKKTTKPIKIRKSQDFYHIASNGALKKVFFKTTRKKIESSSPTSSSIASTSFFDTSISDTSDILFNSSSSENVTEDERISTKLFDSSSNERLDNSITPKKNATDATHKVELTELHSEKSNKTESKKTERGMFILKPEEINKKVLQEKLNEPQESNSLYNEDLIQENVMNEDIENFLANSIVCGSPDDQVFVVSDDTDDEDYKTTKQDDNYKEVLIKCTNIENFGCIRGRKKTTNLSFEFPGFKPTEFYETQQAFMKINQVLSRKIYIPKSFTLQWKVIETEKEMKDEVMLKEEQLGPNFVLTKQGIRHKQELLNNKTSFFKKRIKLSPTVLTKSQNDTPSCSKTSAKVDDKSDLGEQSVTLENQNNFHSNDTLKNKINILISFNDAKETKKDLAEKLSTCDK